jgi:hypothetical protein
VSPQAPSASSGHGKGRTLRLALLPQQAFWSAES